MIRRPPRSTHCISSAASDVYKRQWVAIVKSKYNKTEYLRKMGEVWESNSDISVYFDKLSEITHVSRTIFEDGAAVEIVQLPDHRFLINSVK